MLLLAQLILSIVVNRHAFFVDINTTAVVNSSNQDGLYNGVVDDLHDYYRTGSDLNVVLSSLTLLLYLPVGALGGGYHKNGQKNAALMYMAGIVVLLCMQQVETYSVVGRLSVIHGRNRIVWMLGRDIYFSFTGNDHERYDVRLTHNIDHGTYQDPDGVAALMIIGLVTHALFVLSLVFHYFHLEATHGPTVSKSAGKAMNWMLSSGRKGAEMAWGGYQRVQLAVTGRVIKARPLNSGLLYKEVQITNRDFQNVVQEIAAAWDVEAEQIVSIIKGGDTSFESDTDSWRLQNGDKLEFVAEGVTFSGSESGGAEGQEGGDIAMAPSVHSLRLEDEAMV